MQINLDIDKGGLSDKVGSKIELISSVKLDGPSIAAAGLSLTGEAGLNNLANVAEGLSINAADSLMDMQTKVFDMAYGELETALSDSGVIGAVQLGVEVASTTILFAKKGLDIACSGATIAANTAKMATTLCGIADPNITCVPSVKLSASIIGASIKAILEAKFNDIKLQCIELYNSMICTSSSSVTDNAVASINGILDQVGPLIDPYMAEYTGHTTAEVRYMCNTGFTLVNMLKRASKQAKQAAEDKKAQAEASALAAKDNAKDSVDAAKTEMSDAANGVASGAKDAASSVASGAKDAASNAANGAKDSAANAANNATEQAKDFAADFSKEYSKDQVKAKLMDWLNQLSFGLRNAFQLLMIKDMIEDIKESCSQLTNSSVENLADFVNAVQVVFQIFDLIGYEYKKPGITMDDIKGLGEVLANTALATGQDITNQVRAYSDQVRSAAVNTAGNLSNTAGSIASNAQNTASNVMQSSKDAASGIADSATSAANGVVDSAKGAAENAKDSASGMASGMYGTKDNIMNSYSSMSVDAGMSQLENLASASSNSTEYNGATIVKLKSTTEEKTTTVEVMLYVEPSSSDDVKNFISSYKNSKNKDLFNAATRKKIRDAFEDAWIDNEPITETVSCKNDGVTRKYIFVINPDKTIYNKYLEDKATTSSNQGQTNSLISGATGQLSNVASNLTGSASDMANGAMGNVSGMANGAIDSLGGAAGQATSLLGDTAGAATDSVMGAANNLKDQGSLILDSVSINIDMQYIEAAFAGKVLMFLPIVDMLDALHPLIKALQFLCHLIENYLINKEFVRTKQHASLSKALETMAKLYNGLKDVISLKDTNFFVIRTDAMSKWAKEELHANPDNGGFAIIDIAGTLKLQGYCTRYMISPEIPLSLLKGTTLYFDGVGIQNGNRYDGTTAGLDNIQINLDAEEIYYDAENRPTFASQIIQSNGRGDNPYYEISVSDQLVKTDDPFARMFDSITVESDECEGTQVLSFDNITCCELPEMSEETPDELENVIVVEFGLKYTKGEEVNYSINVNPGDSINEDTILAYIHKDGKHIPVKSIYSSGRIKSIDSESDYLHIYPQYANRHIVIEEPSIGTFKDFSIDDVSALMRKMSDSAEMYQLIVSLLLPSMYPIMLLNAYRTSINSNIAENFNDANSKLSNELALRADDIKELCSEEKIAACGSNPNALVDIKDKMLLIRNVSMYKDVLYYYNGTLPTTLRKPDDDFPTPLSTTKFSGSKTYSDCYGLAYDTPEYQNSDIAKDSYGPDVTTDLNRNYYVTLLSKITTRTGNKFALEYYDLIKEIIDNRLTEESVDADEIIIEFNQLYQLTINGTVSNGYKFINDSGFANIDINNKDDINNLIKFIKNEYLKSVLSAKDNINLPSKIRDYKTQYASLLKALEEKKVDSIDSSLNLLYDDVANTLSTSEYDEDTKSACSSRMNVVTALLANIFIYAHVTQARNKDKYPGPSVKRIKSNKDNVELRLQTYEWALNRWITNNGGKTSGISYNKKTYSKPIEFIAAAYTIGNERHEKNDTDPQYISDVDAYVRGRIRSCIFNDNNNTEKGGSLSDIYSKLIKPYRALYRNSEIELLSDNEMVNNILNEYYYELTCKEADKIHTFWKKILDLYGTTNIGDPEGPWGEYNYKTIEKEIQDYANNLSVNLALWPEPVLITAGKYNCMLYTFINRDVEEPEIPEMNLNKTGDMVNSEMPEPTIDYNQAADLNEPHEGDITIMDYSYWLVYMLNATLFTLIPLYWSDGFDIPPFMAPLLLPAIYLPIAPPIKVPFINVLIVFGISLRGIWPMPIVLLVNMNNHDLNAMLPVMIALEFSRMAFQKIMEAAENIVPNTINALIDKASSENADFKKTADKFRAYASVIRSMPIENKAIIEQEFMDAMYEQLQEFADDRERRKAERALKKRDKRQVITREEDLGEGEEPM